MSVSISRVIARNIALCDVLQIRMGAISQTNVNFVGSHCGVSIGEDGPSQMALEDLALFRSIPGKPHNTRAGFQNFPPLGTVLTATLS